MMDTPYSSENLYKFTDNIATTNKKYWVFFFAWPTKADPTFGPRLCQRCIVRRVSGRLNSRWRQLDKTIAVTIGFMKLLDCRGGTSRSSRKKNRTPSINLHSVCFMNAKSHTQVFKKKWAYASGQWGELTKHSQHTRRSCTHMYFLVI